MKKLILARTKVMDAGIRGLELIPTLEVPNLSGCTKVHDLSALRNRPGLQIVAPEDTTKEVADSPQRCAATRPGHCHAIANGTDGHTTQTNRHVRPLLVFNSESSVEPFVPVCAPYSQRISNHTLAFVLWRFRHLEFARRDAMATVPATPDLATMASIINTVLRGQVIVKTKIFSLRSRAPDVAPRGGYAMSDGVELVPLEQLPQHLQRLRDMKGEAKGLIPATKEIYQHLVDNHVQTYKVTSGGRPCAQRRALPARGPVASGSRTQTTSGPPPSPR
jgi:hypothetical protein